MMQLQEELHLVIPARLAQRVIEYIRNSPSPVIPVKEAMDIIQRISNLPRAQTASPEDKQPANSESKKPVPKPTRAKKVAKKR
jgi:hypothetical protein